MHLTDPTTFGNEMDTIRSKRLKASITETTADFEALPKSEANNKKCRGKIAMLNRLMKLWIPIARTLFLNGVILPNGEIARGRSMNDALFSGWAPIFAEKLIDAELAKIVSERFCSAFDFNLMLEIDLQSFIDF